MTFKNKLRKAEEHMRQQNRDTEAYDEARHQIIYNIEGYFDAQQDKLDREIKATNDRIKKAVYKALQNHNAHLRHELINKIL